MPDGATGEVYGTWMGSGGDVIESSLFRATITAGLDASALHRPGGETIIGFDTHEVAASVAACTTCDPAFAYQIGPIARDIDLTHFRGQRIWLTLEARAFFFIGVPALAVLFDDLHVTTTP